ncbi:hypothetical protein [Halodesulfovibrio marinisediminis]|uniref:Uncharacterized protein n=1 Tax=Halodesulfovibrio marinisediminis DSM 17456 TaxID=1121457 RepID=A0A1N6IGL1_9BACT|nr:hypothetical protein [Halodesulfovibrio marinisediminis]SIO31099.1 hypothetical protein SAMN02745161_2729 [Halodesulfovibrio marinisediminis DSM 17456]
MLVRDRKSFMLGLAMAISFGCVFAALFMPWYGNGRCAFEASDDLFNSISKGSTHYIGQLREQNKAVENTSVAVTLEYSSKEVAEQAALLLSSVGTVTIKDAKALEYNGSLGAMLSEAITDSDKAFYNDEATFMKKYGMLPKVAMYRWWQTLTETEKSLKRQELFAEAVVVNAVMVRGVEVGYNYFGIEPRKASTSYGILTFALVFYVLYTLWWGYALFFLCEGVGLAMKGGSKKEV